jgi:AICAR transformylase/IMP cyclohydrolase PurH
MAFREGIALLSAYHHDEYLRDFARALKRLGWNILAPTRTHTFLEKHSVKVIDLGKVPLFDRETRAALLLGEEEGDEEELEYLKIQRLDLVYVELSPLREELEKQANNPSVVEAHRKVWEMIDVDGPTLLRAAAKGGRWVLSEPDQFIPTLEQLESHQYEDSTRVRHAFAYLAEMAVAKHALAAAEFYESIVVGTFPGQFKKK